MGDLLYLREADHPDRVLDNAKGDYQDVLLIGWDNNGDLNVRANLGLKNKDILWLLSLVKHRLVAGDYNGAPTPPKQNA